MSEVLVNVYRGKYVESIHYGDIAVVDRNGQEIYRAGDSRRLTYWRSAAKPFQVMPIIFSGAAEKFGLTEKEIALMAASHSGEKEHVEVVRSILDKIGLDETALLCGVHPPYHKPTARLIWKSGADPEPVHNNCSGKHAGLLTLCRFHGWDINNYLAPEHPVQQLILDVISQVTAYPRQKIILGEDGCGVVVFGLPLNNMAYAYTRLANPELLPDKYQQAAELISRSMEEFPRMVGGSDRFNTDLMKVTGRKIVAKLGAEGIFCVGVHGKMGIALKIGDGHPRAIPPVMVEILQQLGVLDQQELKLLDKYHYAIVKNHHKHVVGELRPAFQLEKLEG